MKIKEIADKFHIKIIEPAGHTLNAEVASLNSCGHNGNILFNLKPLNHLNVIHFALFSYLKVFSQNSFKCTIILQDLITANGDFMDEINTQDEANQAMDLLFDRIKLFIGKLDNIEIIPESSLLRLYNRGQRKFFYDLIKLSSIADKTIHSTQVIKSFDHIDSLCCLLYESFIKPNYVITGGSELETVWYQLRKRGNLTPIFGDSYRSPIMLSLPPLKKFNEDELISTLDTFDPFCQTFILENEMAFQEGYASKIKLLNREINMVGSSDPLDIIRQFRSMMYN